MTRTASPLKKTSWGAAHDEGEKWIFIFFTNNLI